MTERKITVVLRESVKLQADRVRAELGQSLVVFVERAVLEAIRKHDGSDGPLRGQRQEKPA